MQKMEYVRELMKQTLRNNKLCCCSGDFECQNCRELDTLQEPREFSCPVCIGVEA